MIRNIIFIFLLAFQLNLFSQPAPAGDENIPFLVTFGAESNTSWGDDDFCQVHFVVVPFTQTGPIYIRVYDPDTGEDYDEPKADFNTYTSFSVYGGNGCWSDTSAQSSNPAGNYRSGILLATRTFGNDPRYNKGYYTFGPFNPFEGESAEKLGGRVFKIIAKGEKGNDGNLYKYFLSIHPDRNVPVEGGNIVTYEYSFRLPNDQNQICQIYPFVDDKTVSIQISNFDWDDDGIIKIISVAKNGILCDISGEDNWITRKFPILEDEKNTSIEIQFIKNQKNKVLNNNVVVSVRNQYGISLPFYVIPIGGIPVYTPKIRMKSVQ